MKRIKISFAEKCPEFCEEWDYEKNKLGPEDYNYGVSEEVWWICKKCRHNYKMKINRRSSQKSGCPKCGGKYVDETNSFLAIHPELCEEWDYELNGLGPENYRYGSKKKVYWMCKKCGFKYKSSICGRHRGNGCRRCSGKYIDETNCLLTKSPELCKEWDYELNKLGPEKYSPHSNRYVNWICKKMWI